MSRGAETESEGRKERASKAGKDEGKRGKTDIDCDIGPREMAGRWLLEATYSYHETRCGGGGEVDYGSWG